MNKQFKFIILFLLSLIISTSAETIKEIRIIDSNGNKYDLSSVLAYTTFSAGDIVSDRRVLLDTIASDIEKMKSSGRYSYVDSYLLVENNEWIIVYEVIAKQRLRKIEIRGANKVSNKKIRKKSELVLGELVDDAAFEEAVLKIKKSYHDYWYPDTIVSWASIIDQDKGYVDLVIDINEGDKISIDKIIFDGNNLINDKTLFSIIMQKEKNYLSFITNAGRYEPDFIEIDIYALQSFYVNRGFLDAKVYKPILDKSNPKESTLLYEINEGRHYRIGEFKIIGMKSLQVDKLMNRISLTTGEDASLRKVQQQSQIIRSFYGNRGYVFTSVNISYDADPNNGIVNIEYKVDEGQKGIIASIDITGNNQTLDEVIRRELVILPGDEYNQSRIDVSKNRLQNLNYFSSVNINPQIDQEDGLYDLIVKVEEKPTGQFNAGIGMSSVDSLIGYVDISQGNFKAGKWPPVGGGQKFQARIQAGTRRNDIELSFSEPWFLDQKLSFGVNIYHRESRYFSDVYDQFNDGLRVSLGKPINRDMRHTLAYKIEQYKVENYQNASPAIQAEGVEGRRLSSGVEYIFSYDTRNKSFGSTYGNRTTISPYFNGGFLGAETDIYGLQIKSTHFTPLIWDMVFVTRLKFESVSDYGDTVDVPLFDRLFLGGTYTLRGYDYREVGPRDSADPDGDSIGGNTSVFASTELTFPLWDNVRGAVFYDWGVVNEDSWDLNPSMYNDNYGFGVRLALPGFPLQLDYGWPIQYHEDRGESGKGRFNFLMGYIY